MLDGAAALLSYQAGTFFATGEAPKRLGNRHPLIVPYETFTASDGDFIVAVGTHEQYRRFCGGAGLDGLAPAPRVATNARRGTPFDTLRPLTARAPRGR